MPDEYSISQLTEDESAADSDLMEVAKDNGDGTFTSRKQLRSTFLADKAAQADLDAHEADTANPHSVTKTQVGLSNADNTSDTAKPISTATQSALDAKASTTSLNTHTADTANPHSVTKTQVGLSNVDNTADLAKPVSTAQQTALDGKSNTNHTHDERYYTETETDTALALKADDSDIPATIVESVVAGTNVTVDNTDPANPVVSASGGGGGGGAVDSVNGETGVVVLDADDIDDSATTHKFATAAQLTKVDGVESGATADQTGAEIKTAYEAEADTNAYTDAEKSKLAGVASGAEVNVQSDWDAVSGDAQILSKPTLGTAASSDTGDFATAAQGATADSAVQPAGLADFETITELNTRDTNNRSRANHTGSQAISTITDLQTTLNAKLEDVDIADINATGTADDSTYLRGDGTRETPAGGGGSGVSSVAKNGETGLTGDVTLSAGDNITLTQSGNDIEIAAAGGGGGGSSAVMSGVATNYGSWDNFAVTTGGGASSPSSYQLIISDTDDSIEVRNTMNTSSDNIPTPVYMNFMWGPTAYTTGMAAKITHRWFSGNNNITQGYRDQIGFDVTVTDGVWADTNFSTGDGSTEQVTAVAIDYYDHAYYSRGIRTEAVYDGTSVEFYVDGTLRATHSTNVPRFDSAITLRSFAHERIEGTADTSAANRLGLFSCEIKWPHGGS